MALKTGIRFTPVQGIGQEQLGRIFAPAGIPIHSQTPEEIAVSIAAQIIAVKQAQKDKQA